MKNVVILASGRGSNFRQVLRHNKNEYSCCFQQLIYDQPKAPVADLAKRAGIATTLIEPKKFAKRNVFDETLFQKIREFKPDLILTLGFLRILSKKTVAFFKEKIINIHPSLLPAFPGLNAQRQAWEYGVKVSGATTHFVTEKLDQGPIICQDTIVRYPHDTFAEFSQRILEKEHQIIVETVAYFCQNRIMIKDNRFVAIRE